MSETATVPREHASATADAFTVTSNTETAEQIAASIAPDTPAPPEATQQPTEPPAELPEKETPEPDPTSEAGKQLATKKKSLQARIDEITREKYDTARERDEARTKAAKLEADLAALKAPKAEPPAVEPPKADAEPTVDQFDTYEAFVKAQARWEVRQELKADRERQQRETFQRSQQDAIARVVTEGTKAHPDFDQVLGSMLKEGVKFSEVISEVIAFHPLGHELAYTLAGDLTEARRLSSITHPMVAALELGKVLARLDAAPSGPVIKTPSISTAQPPIKPVGSSPVASDDPNELEFGPAYVKAMNKRDGR